MEWVDRHGCRESRDGPWMARGGVPTEQSRRRGNLSAAKAVRWGESALVTLPLLQSDSL